ncbi:MFS transporter, DHA1 family, bicyclomycin/chloramphenicol resistance protein [Atopomonas hussainii]|uniref:Bcr/CflA family efflux transporter n=1 Tax=Atopomonas hussainii TaxID=1429083 RepID=A0A1H7SR08_9GAMM|nr:Bcr/CflA family multidrug efflux MFS transporter [Atopomonas hussainii]SEL74943.1 MFS transporter, DHA1 family, bicyclomycin/chloramphenicol resistance protein [Atopomonas hussainii]
MPLRLLLILGALSAFGPLAIDFYLPSFPTLAKAFATDVQHVQWSLSAYFVGVALGQLFYGPMADRYGRRKPLLVGITLFALASVACAMATTLEQLIAARFVQALGGCAGMVVARAVVRDLCDTLTTAKVFSQLMLVMGLAPILAPIAGGWLLVHASWPWIFLWLALIASLCLLAVALYLPETLPSELPRAKLSQAGKQYRRLLSDRRFMAYGLSGGLVMAGMFAYIAGSPYVFISLYGISEQHYGWLFGANAAGFIIAAQINARLLRYAPPQVWLGRIMLITVACALVLLVIAQLQPRSLWPILVPLFGYIASIGCLLPNATACAMSGQAANAGSASAMLGFSQFAVAGFTSALVGVLHNGTAQPLAWVMGACAVLALLCVLSSKGPAEDSPRKTS